MSNLFKDKNEYDGSEEFQEELVPENFQDVLTWGADWTIETLFNLIKKGKVDLDPEMQRRDVWNAKKKSILIESIILNIPIPQIILAESKINKGTYFVIDGKQRLLSIMQFMSSGLDEEDEIKKLTLSNLSILTDLNGKDYSDIQDDDALKEYLSIFENQTIRTIIIKNWSDEALLFSIFNRLNTGTEKLSPQELRMSLYPGGFISFVNNESYFEGMGRILNIDQPDPRMRDAELVVRYYSFYFFYHDYHGNLRKFFDESVKKLNDKWEGKEEEIKGILEKLKEVISLTYTIFDENSFKKFDTQTKTYSRQFNKAAFDLLAYTFSNEKIMELLKNDENQPKVKAAYEELFSDEKIVNEFISHTTDLSKVKYRFEKFQEILFHEFKDTLEKDFLLKQ